MIIGDIKYSALLSLRGKWGQAFWVSIILAFFFYLIPTGIEIYISGGFWKWLEQDHVPVKADMINSVITLFLFPITAASYWYYLSLVRNEHWRTSQLFSVYKTSMGWKLIWTSVLTVVFSLLWGLLLIIPGIVKGTGYSQAYLLLKDHPEYTALQAIRESQERMKGLKMDFFLLNLSFLGWGLLCILSFGIGFLWLVPYMGVANAHFYQKHIHSTEHEAN